MSQAWAFTQHGHIFFVLQDVLDGQTYVCDLATGQWHRWFTGELDYWNMFNGVMWRGKPIAAGASGPELWYVDPDTVLDEGELQIARCVTGFQPFRGDDSYRQGTFRVTLSNEDPSLEGAVLALSFSDDGGRTWVGPYEAPISTFSTLKQWIEFRSLGRMRAPGRIWQISDIGGAVRIDGADSDMETP